MKYRWLRHSPFVTANKYLSFTAYFSLFTVFYTRHLPWATCYVLFIHFTFKRDLVYLRTSSKAIPARRPEWQKVWWDDESEYQKPVQENVITHTVIPAPDQVEDDVKDTIYQIAKIPHAVIPDPRSGRGWR